MRSCAHHVTFTCVASRDQLTAEHATELLEQEQVEKRELEEQWQGMNVGGEVRDGGCHGNDEFDDALFFPDAAG